MTHTLTFLKQCAVSDWRRYLLPAGYSDSLGARVTQMVDLDWGTTLDHLTGIMSNNVATKLFSKKSVLVLGPEYFPPPARGKKVFLLFALDGWVDNMYRRVLLALARKMLTMAVALFRALSCPWALLVWKPCRNSSTPPTLI
jgi:hypothetical protein